MIDNLKHLPRERAELTATSRFRDRDFNKSPMIVFYEVTRACGLVCKHCRACAQTHSDPAELSKQDAFGLIDQLAQFPQPPMLVLTGGDPLCRADIYELINYATVCGLEVSITPSATPLVTPGAIRRFASSGIHRMAISIDGANAKAHDEVRGVTGSFQRSIEILQEARQAGIATQINTTLTPDNVDSIDELAELFAGLDITLWSVFFLVPVGRATEADRLTAEQCENAFAELWRQTQHQSYLIKTTEAPHFRRFALQQRKASNLSDSRTPSFLPHGVNDGKGIMFVSHTGLVHPSGFLPITCGSFPQQNVVDIYQNSPVFQALRDSDRLEGKCGQCEYRNVCGGSRARSYAITGNILAEEPDCAYAPKVRRVDRTTGK
ncbi:MAG: TIGR04053 family radical SAM/SPASM domain-containing protein [Planctomycetaceae bacterium]|nr:TIGR04053 family radical SAM/SPASM domain-containing protein [Planctomycetaceae bacterium]